MVRAINKISISIMAAGPEDHARPWQGEARGLREREDRRAILTPLFRDGLAA